MKKLLIVDDDRFIGKAYQVKLQSEGIEIKVVENGQEAIDMLKTFTPDLILLDLIMPVKDGFTFLEELKSDKLLAKIPVLVITNLSDRQDQDAVKNLGALKFINKTSISLDDLVKEIKSHLD